MKTEQPRTKSMTAANDNPGGETTVMATLHDVATLMARAYVAELKKKERA